METERKRRRRRLLAEHPTCYLCGGLNASTTVDHVPPRACFPRGYMPEEFEFPACAACNASSRAEDKVFGFWAMALDFDGERAKSRADYDRIVQLMTEIATESPQELSGLPRPRPIFGYGEIVTSTPMAFSFQTPKLFKHAAGLISIKLTHALYFRETKNYLNPSHRFTGSVYQPQVRGTEHFTSYISSLLPKLSIGARTNIKNYGNRFAYRSGYKEDEDFFFYAAQFGRGLIAWGMVCGPKIERPTDGPLSAASWHNGAWGAARTSSQDRPSRLTEKPGLKER